MANLGEKQLMKSKSDDQFKAHYIPIYMFGFCTSFRIRIRKIQVNRL